jgi:hypothetical protein
MFPSARPRKRSAGVFDGEIMAQTSSSDLLGRALGVFGIGLGVAEIVAPGVLTRALGLRGAESLVRAFGLREVVSGILTLAVDRRIGLWTRVAGDVLDLATVAPGLRRGAPQRADAALAVLLLAGVLAVDLVAARRSRRGG